MVFKLYRVVVEGCGDEERVLEGAVCEGDRAEVGAGARSGDAGLRS